MNLKKMVDTLFLVEKENEGKGLKVFYNVDILIHSPNEKEASMPAQDITNNTNVTQQAPQNIQQQEEFRSKIKNLLGEDEPAQQETQPISNIPATPAPVSANFQKKASGVIAVPHNEIENIQTLEDFIDFVADKKEKSGNQIIDEVAIELIFAMAGINQTPLQEIVKQNDRVIIDLSYGNKPDDCIGFKVLKRTGVSNVSIVMKKDGEVIDSPFDLKQFNSQLVLFRNSVMKK